MRLLIISASARFIGASCLAAGFEIDAFDFFADWDLQQRCSAHAQTNSLCRRLQRFDDVFLFAEKSKCDAAIFGGGMEHQPSLIRRLAQIIPVLGTNSTSLARLNCDENGRLLASRIESAGGYYPETKLQLSTTDNPAQWLKKKVHGAGGRHVQIATSSDVDRPPVSIKTIEFQRRIPGENVSAVFLGTPKSNGCCELLGVTRQLVGEASLAAAPFAYCGSIGPLACDRLTLNIIEAIGASVSIEFEIVGVFGIDFIVNDEGVWPVDVNPRIPASAEIVELVGKDQHRSCNIARLHVSACLGNTFESPVSPVIVQHGQQRMIGKAILFCSNAMGMTVEPALLEGLIDLHWDGLSGQLPERWLADIPNSGCKIRAGDPILSLFQTGISEADVSLRLQEFAFELHAQMNSTL